MGKGGREREGGGAKDGWMEGGKLSTEELRSKGGSESRVEWPETCDMGFRAVFAEAGWSRGRCSISLCIRTGARRMPACIGCALILHSCLYCGHCPIVIMHVFQRRNNHPVH